MPKRLGLVRIGVIYGGANWQKKPLEELKDKESAEISFLDLYELAKQGKYSKCNLLKYDILIVPYSTDQDFLSLNLHQIEGFLKTGRILVSFGEEYSLWIPQCRWMGKMSNRIHISIPQHPIFNGLKNEDLSDWEDSAHGYFFPPDKATILAETEEHNVVLFLEKDTYDGIILASTLDPDFHSTLGVKGAKTLLANIINWAVKEASFRKNQGRIKESRIPTSREVLAKIHVTIRELYRDLPSMIIGSIIVGLLIRLIMEILKV